MKPKVICLLPVRNAAADLPGFFSSAVHFADAFISLDDGSTDETPQILRSHPLVVKVLSNPRRSDFTGWDDAANRNALLAAASEFQPDWIISVDADERIPDDDALALKRFLEHDAIPGVAYGFRCYSMAGDLSHALRNPIWVYRLFAYQPGLRFPDQALHFAPIPTSIPRRAFLRTTFRIQHLGGMSSERRLARYEKYRQVDPECRFWPDYSSLLAESSTDQLMEWSARSPETPVFYTSDLDSDSERTTGDVTPEGGPVLAVVVVDDGNTEAFDDALDSVLAAETDHSIEVIAVSGRESDFGGDDRVRWITVDKDVRSVARRNIGLNAARAANVLFVDSTLRLEPSSIPALCEAHQTGYAVVSGRIECDRSNQLALTAHRMRFGKGSGETGAGILARVPRWASYRRSLLLEAGGFDKADSAGAELLMARKLETLGYLAYSIGEPVARFHFDDHIKTRSLLHKAFQLGRAEARFTMSQFRDRGALFGGEAIRSSLPAFLSREKQNDQTRSPVIQPQEARNGMFDLAKLAGETTELLRPGRNKALLLFGHPAGIALLVIFRIDKPSVIALVRFDLSRKTLAILVLPVGTIVPGPSGSPVDLQQALQEDAVHSIDRFTAHDLIGRPFQLELDEIIVFREEHLPAEIRMLLSTNTVTTIPSVLPDSLTVSRCLAFVRESRAKRGIDCTLPARAQALALLRLRATPPERITLVELPVTGETIDADAVQFARTFLDADGIVRPPTRRNRLRMVEWA